MPAYMEGFTDNNTTSELAQFRTQLANIIVKKNGLDKYINNGLTKDLGTATNSFSTYVTSCGINPSDAINKLNVVKGKLKEYNQSVARPLSVLRKQVLAALNVSAQSRALTDKYKALEDLRKELDELEASASTAYTREAVLDTRDDAVSFRQTYGHLNRPLRRYSVPILIIFSLIFAGIGIYGITFMAGDSATPFRAIGGFASVIVIGVIVVLKLMKQL
jgi:hypothetical protein